MRPRGAILRKLLGVILALTGTIIIIEFVPLRIWYISLVFLILIFITVLFWFLY